MQATQLELDLWTKLESAAVTPKAVNLTRLWQEMEAAIAPLPQQLKLQTAGEAILKITQIYASRSNWLLSDWEDANNTEGPVLEEEMLLGLMRQSMTLDLTALLEPLAPKQREHQTQSEAGSSIAGTVGKAALLDMLDEMAAESTQKSADPTQVAHQENISAWAEAISRWMQQRGKREAVSLLQLQQALGMPLVDIWLGLLLSKEQQYDWEQRGDFYNNAGEVWLQYSNSPARAKTTSRLQPVGRKNSS